MLLRTVCGAGPALLLVLCSTGAARARGDCTGGKLLRGGYGVIIYGTTATGGAAALSGAMLADGHCGLTGSLTGNVAGTEMLAVPATGTYNVGADFTGGMTITMGGSPALGFAVNWVVRHRQLVGVENDGLGSVQVTAREQQNTRFSQQTLSGGFSYLCSSPLNQPDFLLSVNFDGVGAATATGSRYNSGALVQWGPGHGGYTVNPDGSYTLDLLDSAGNEYFLGGVIDSGGYNAPAAEIAENKSGAIFGPAHCVGQRQ